MLGRQLHADLWIGFTRKPVLSPQRTSWSVGLVLAMLLAGSGVVCAQRVAVGGEAGVPVTASIARPRSPRVDPATYRLVGGPALDLSIAGPLSVRFNALYQRVSFRQEAFGRYILASKTTGDLWQFPILLKCRIPAGEWDPFITAGPSFQVATRITRSSMSPSSPTPYVDHPEPEHRAIAGFAAGAGVDLKRGRLRISPEVRYTRWSTQTILTDINRVGTKLDQLQVLVGITLALGSR